MLTVLCYQKHYAQRKSQWFKSLAIMGKQYSCLLSDPWISAHQALEIDTDKAHNNAMQLGILVLYTLHTCGTGKVWTRKVQGNNWCTVQGKKGIKLRQQLHCVAFIYSFLVLSTNNGKLNVSSISESSSCLGFFLLPAFFSSRKYMTPLSEGKGWQCTAYVALFRGITYNCNFKY